MKKIEAATVVMTVREDHELGGLGLALPGMDRDGVNPSTDGLTVAHDLLEHQNGAGEIGGIDDELEALGAIWFVRGQFDDLRRDDRGSRFTVHENIASDVVRMFRDYFYGAPVETDARVPLSRPLPEADEDFREVIRCAVKDALRELSDDADEKEAKRQLRKYLRVCLPRMRAGYRKARRRFKDARNANRLFWAITEAVDQAIGKRSVYNSASGLEAEGQQYTLEYTLTQDGAATARCWESTYDDMSDEE